MRSRRFLNAARGGAIAAVSLLIAACQPLPQSGGGIACTMQYVYGISATVTDAATGANVTPGSYMVVREGSYVDSVSAIGEFLAAAGERAGTYSVTVGRPGYAAFHRSGVVVTRDECHVHPVLVEARLQRAD
jgi:hypothetical protein